MDYEGRLREGMHQLELSFICNKLRLLTEVPLPAFRMEFPFVPRSDEYIRAAIEEQRWQAKIYIWKAEEVNALRNAARQNWSEEDVWLALRVM
jgi:hypothetical protein